MAKDKPAKYWRFKLDTRRKFTELSQEIARINSGGGGGGISELTSKMVVDALGYTPYNANNPANYITSAALTPYLKTEDAEETYATKDFVTTKLVDYAPLTSVQGFENRIGGLEGAVPQLNERVDSNDEQIAILNETTSGHTTSIGTLTQRVDSVEQLASTKLDSSYFTLTNIKSTLGISDWALASTKPSYAWSEITSRPTALSQFTDDVVDGKYLPLSGGTVIGSITASTFIGNLTGNADSAGNADRVGGYGEDSFVRWRGYTPLSDIDNISKNGVYYGNNLSVIDGAYRYGTLVSLQADEEWTEARIAQMYFSDRNKLYVRSKYTNAWNGHDWKEVAFTDSNVASATKLQKRVKLWGNDFDGTAGVSGNLYSDIWKIIKDSTWNGTFIQSANYDGTSDLGNIYMSAMSGNKLTSFNVWANNSKFSDNVTVAGNVGIGNTSPTERLDVSGNIKADGNINATSITINGVTITASNGTITVNGNVFAKGDITGGV